MKFAARVKTTLINLIHEMACEPAVYVKHPGKDFSKKRKLDFETTIHIILTMSKKSSQDELLDYFEHKENTPTTSALIQQRDKLNENTFPFLLQKFNKCFPGSKTYRDRRLLACDGSDMNIFRNPEDLSTYYRNSLSDKGFNELHIDALFDLCNKTYQKINIVGRHEQDERRALIDFMQDYMPTDKCLFIADRNYESYNVIAHAQKRNLDYLIRTKDINSNGILSSFHFSEQGEFDKQIFLNLVRSRKEIDRNNTEKYRLLGSNSTFDFIDKGNPGIVPVSFRIVRFLIGTDRYETIITNLSSDEFPPFEIKKIYGMRWGIENAFRELKYTIGLNRLHSKKADHIRQEIFAKVILYNFCETIIGHIATTKKCKKHTYQINFTRALQECRYYFTCKPNVNPPNLEAIIRKYLLPVRPGRTNPRKVKIREKVTFLYR